MVELVFPYKVEQHQPCYRGWQAPRACLVASRRKPLRSVGQASDDCGCASAAPHAVREPTGGHSRSKPLTIRHTVGLHIRGPIFPWKLRQPLAGGERESPGESSNADRDQILRDDACLRRGSLIEAPLVAALAQLVEHIIRNDGVTGSSPVSGTIPSTRDFQDIRRKSLSAGSPFGSSLGYFGQGIRLDPRHTLFTWIGFLLLLGNAPNATARRAYLRASVRLLSIAQACCSRKTYQVPHSPGGRPPRNRADLC